jgi:antitoxin HicB
MKTKKKKHENIHAGSSFNDFLIEEGIFEQCQEVGAKYAFIMQLEDEMKRQNLTKEELAKRMETSRSSLDRLLDPSKSCNLKSMIHAASAVGKHIRINMF